MEAGGAGSGCLLPPLGAVAVGQGARPRRSSAGGPTMGPYRPLLPGPTPLHRLSHGPAVATFAPPIRWPADLRFDRFAPSGGRAVLGGPSGRRAAAGPPGGGGRRRDDWRIDPGRPGGCPAGWGDHPKIGEKIYCFWFMEYSSLVAVRPIDGVVMVWKSSSNVHPERPRRGSKSR